MTKKTLAALAAATLAATLGGIMPSVARADVAFNVGAVTDYRYRGISLSDDQPAAQLTLVYDAPRGWYAGAFASSVRFAAPRRCSTQRWRATPTHRCLHSQRSRSHRPCRRGPRSRPLSHRGPNLRPAGPTSRVRRLKFR